MPEPLGRHAQLLDLPCSSRLRTARQACVAGQDRDTRRLCFTAAPRRARGAVLHSRPQRLSAQAHDGEVVGSEDVQYVDTTSDIAFINMCRRAYGGIAGWQSPRRWDDGRETYLGMVDVSRAIMKGRSAAEQRDAVISGFPEVPPLFRRLFPYTRWGAELNARITPAFFTWLVGPMEPKEVEVDGQMQRSGVHIKRCRYLAESGCVGMCVNLCKSPTQTFFTEQLGMPLTMTPNFEDLSCEMVFGARPPPLDQDPVNIQPCLASCPAGAASPSGACHKLA